MKGISQAEIDAAAKAIDQINKYQPSGRTLARAALRAARDARLEPYRQWSAATRELLRRLWEGDRSD